MKIRWFKKLGWSAFVFGLCCQSVTLLAQDAADQPRPTPLTRDEMKRFLEDLKQRTPRIPLPPLTAEEEANADPRAHGYESRLRSLYLSSGDLRGYLAFAGSPAARPGEPPRFTIEPDPVMSLDYPFKTRLFWIASRANNCQYCLGHQESKLLATGMTDDQLAQLDLDWSAFPENEQAAFALARRITLEPHRLSDADIEACRKYYTDLQIIEMVMSVSGNNSINRWKEGAGIPQASTGGNFGGDTGEGHTYQTPTSAEFTSEVSRVVASGTRGSGDAWQPTIFARPLLSVEEVRAGLAAAETRAARLPVPSDAEARQNLDDELEAKFEGESLPAWVRMLSPFTVAGKNTISVFVSTERDLGLDPLLMARIDFAMAHQDGAWYAMGNARNRLRELGQTDVQIEGLIDGSLELPASHANAVTLARHLGASPIVLTDAEVAAAVESNGPGDVVKIIHYVALRAAFDRFTEAAALPID